MKINRPLVNPTPRDFQNDTEEGQGKETETYKNKEQISLGIDTGQSKIKQMASSLKQNLNRRSELVEVSKFWKSPAIPFMMVSSVFNALLLLVGGVLLFGKLPSEIQLFYNPVDQNWNPESKIIHVIILPVVLLIAFIFLYRLLKYVFILDRRLALTIAWVITFINILLLVAIGQIYQLNPI